MDPEHAQVPGAISEFMVGVMQQNMDVVKDKLPTICKDMGKRFCHSPITTVKVYGPAIMAVQKLKGAIPKLGKTLAQGCATFKNSFTLEDGIIGKISKLMKEINEGIKDMLAAIGSLLPQLGFLEKVTSMMNKFVDVLTGGRFGVSMPTFDDFKMPTLKIPDCIKTLGTGFMMLLSSAKNVLVQRFSAFGLAFHAIIDPDGMEGSGALKRMRDFCDHTDDRVQCAAIGGWFKLGLIGKYKDRSLKTLQKLAMTASHLDTRAAAAAAVAAIRAAHGLGDMIGDIDLPDDLEDVGGAVGNFASNFGISW